MAKTNTSSTPRKRPASAYPSRQITRTELFQAGGLLLLAAISSPLSQLSLHPVYGSIPSYLYHQHAILYTSLVSLMIKDTLSKYLPADPKPLTALLAFSIPSIQLLLTRFSEQLGPHYGPLLTELLTYFPLLLLSGYSASRLLAKVDVSRYGKTVGEFAVPILAYVFFSFTQKAASFAVPRFVGADPMLMRTMLQLVVASFYAALSPPTWLLMVAAMPLLHTVLRNPHFVMKGDIDRVNESLTPINFNLVDRRESVTGVISVLINLETEILFMRCDHSLLGGEWLVTPERKAAGQIIREPIYKVFTMLDAVRLIETGDKRPDSEKKALNIGLGIGTTPKSMIADGVDTTIVELDPVVHQFAVDYFELPQNHTEVIENAVTYVERESRINPHSFDLIVHDVFTGGAEPPALFTVEFLTGLRELLSAKGAIAINYAGDLTLPGTNLVLNAIYSVFPTCRLFRDSAPGETPDADNFVNMVVYCLPTAATSPAKQKLQFRTPGAKDFGESVARKSYLLPTDSQEVEFDWPAEKEAQLERRVLSAGNAAELEKHHVKSALLHWKVMRTVLPAKVWELW